jgi:hypothetical protein
VRNPPAPPPSALQVSLNRLQATYRALVRVRLPRIFGLVLRNPRDSLCAVALMLAVTAIVTNALYLQPGRHPAPIFAIRPLPVRSDEPAAAGQQSRPSGADASRLERRSESRPEPAAKNDVPLPRPRTQNAFIGSRADAAAGSRAEAPADAVSPPWQVTAIQRTLNQAGYGPIRVSGILDDGTREGIARFEKDHNMPVTGQNTPRVRHALTAATGRILD